MLKFFDANPGSGMEKILIRDGKIGSVISACIFSKKCGWQQANAVGTMCFKQVNIPDPQH
jgi:hypothetical protein